MRYLLSTFALLTLLMGSLSVSSARADVDLVINCPPTDWDAPWMWTECANQSCVRPIYCTVKNQGSSNTWMHVHVGTPTTSGVIGELVGAYRINNQGMVLESLGMATENPYTDYTSQSWKHSNSSNVMVAGSTRVAQLEILANKTHYLRFDFGFGPSPDSNSSTYETLFKIEVKPYSGHTDTNTSSNWFSYTPNFS